MCADGLWSNEISPLGKPRFGGAKKKASPSTKPIVSYGIILYHWVVGTDPPVDSLDFPKRARTIENLRFLVYQRRDTYEYIDLLRGIWSSDKKLREMCMLLSAEEKQRLREYDFRALWDDLWTAHGSNIHLEGYDRAQRKYESIREKVLEYISITPPSYLSTPVVGPPWGFPKGKRNEREREVDCALREFREETRLSIDTVRILEGVPLLEEQYTARNQKSYHIYYFLAESTEQMPVRKYNTEGCIRPQAVSEEAADARWVTYQEACTLLDGRKSTILSNAIELILLR